MQGYVKAAIASQSRHMQGDRMRKICATLFAVATAFSAREALAQDWSMHGGDIVRGDAIGGEFGWPDASFVWHHGLSGKVDIGIKFPLIYGAETTVEDVRFGMGLMVPIRLNIVRTGKFSGMLIFMPGLRLYPTDGADFGPAFTIGFQGGVKIIPEAQVTFGADFNFWIDVTSGVMFVFAPEFGPGFEYHVDRNLALSEVDPLQHLRVDHGRSTVGSERANADARAAGRSGHDPRLEPATTAIGRQRGPVDS